jgi:probable HAF family extracellular repeat protein
MKSSRVYFVVAMMFVVSLALAFRGGAQQTTQARFKIIDLGTFGGPNSFFAGPFPPAQDVNNRGTAVGTADTTTPDPFFPNCFTDCFTSHAFKWEGGALIDLGVLPTFPGGSSQADWVSASGRITGHAGNGLIDPLTGFPEVRAVVWTEEGQIIDLGTLGGNVSFPNDVNDLGQVVGFATNAIPDPFSFPGTQMRGFLWENGVMLDVGTLGGPDAVAFFVNNRGQIAGVSFTDSTPNPSTGMPTVHPFLLENGSMKDLGTLGGLGGPANFNGEGLTVEVNALNSQGEVAGTSPLAGDEAHHAVLWDGTLKDLGTLGGINSQAFWVSDTGLAVGRADVLGSQSHHAFLWKNGVMTDLGVLGSCLNSTAFSVNSQGQVVGDTGACPDGGGGPSFFSEQGQPMVDINTLVLPGSDIEVVDALYINDAGVVAGGGILPSGDFHTVLLVPASPAEIAAAAATATQNRPAPRNQAVPWPRTAAQSNPAWPRVPWLRDLSRRHRLP